MSYLVDALKKAEHERHASRDGDLHSAATMPSTGRSGLGGFWRWLVAVLVASNVALAIYVWRPAVDRTTAAKAQASMTRARSGDGSAASGPSSAENTLASAQAALQAGAPRLATRSNMSAPQNTTSVAAQAAPTSAESTPSLDNGTNQGGSVVYSKVPLNGAAGASANEGGRATTAANPNDTAGDTSQAGSAASADAGASGDDESDDGNGDASNASLPMQSDLSVPQIQINGQLYSSQPGRSFILVNGRRYHEGERLAAGPAVETIEPNGAILNYQGQRYQVRGPGSD